MKEKINSTNFNELSLEDAQNLLNELLTYDGNDFKDLVVLIIDNIEFPIINNNINESIELIFNNERVKYATDQLLEEYKEVE